MPGFVYLLTNDSLEGMVKPGITTKSPLDRAKQLRRTGVPTPFTLEWAFWFQNPEQIEREFHNYFADYRVAIDREFFEMELADAIEYLNNKIYDDTGNVESIDAILTMRHDIEKAITKAAARGVCVTSMYFFMSLILNNMLNGAKDEI
jgi:hypothetical protein